MKLTSIPDPCYERKLFWVQNQLVTFEFGEYSFGNTDGEVVATWLVAMYVWHQTDASGNPTGTSSYQLTRVNDRAAGQQLVEAATQEAAAAWLLAWQQWGKGAGFFTWLRKQCRRQLLHWRWQLRH
jgi:hypothetical protein